MKGINLGASGQLAVVGQDNEQVNFNVSEQTAQAFARDQASVRAEAIQESFSDSQGLDYLTNVSRQLGASEAYSLLNDARRVQVSTESYGANMETALVHDYATNHYGAETPENIRKSMLYFNHLAENDPDRLNNMIEGFLGGSGYGRGSTTTAVSSALDATRNRIHDDAILKGATNYSVETAGKNSLGVTPNSIVPPNSKDLREPESNITDEKADYLRNVNRHEETGKGRIRTTPTRMAEEGVGKLFKGVVDSQGMRSTDKGSFDYVHQVENPYEIGGDPKPIPKDAHSTIGGKP